MSEGELESTGESATGGSTTGGSATDVLTTGGLFTGGSATDGMTAGGSATGGMTAGSLTTGGATAGDTENNPEEATDNVVGVAQRLSPGRISGPLKCSGVWDAFSKSDGMTAGGSATGGMTAGSLTTGGATAGDTENNPGEATDNVVGVAQRLSPGRKSGPLKCSGVWDAFSKSSDGVRCRVVSCRKLLKRTSLACAGSHLKNSHAAMNLYEKAVKRCIEDIPDEIMTPRVIVFDAMEYRKKLAIAGASYGISYSFFESPEFNELVRYARQGDTLPTVTRFQLSATVNEVLAEWDITIDRVLAFTVDGASNMRVALKEYTSENLFQEMFTFDHEAEMEGDSATRQCQFALNGIPFDKRLVCMCHVLVLCLSDAVKGSPYVTELIGSLKAVIKMFTSSHLLQEQLIRLAGRGVLTIPKTRYVYIAHVAKRFEDRENIQPVLDERGQEIYWSAVEIFLKIVTPIATYKYQDSVSNVLPGLTALRSKLIAFAEEFKMGSPEMSNVAEILLQSITDRFSLILDPSVHSFNALYSAATFLNPKFRDSLLQYRTYVVHFISSMMLSNNNNSDADQSAFNGSNEPDEEMETHDPLGLSSLSSFATTTSDRNVRQSSTDQQLSFYQNHRFSVNDETSDSVSYWSNQLSTPLSTLARTALDILSVQGSSAATERSFSMVRLTQGLNRVGLYSRQLSAELRCKLDRRFIE